MSLEQRDVLLNRYLELFNKNEKQYLTEEERHELDSLRVASIRLTNIRKKEKQCKPPHSLKMPS